jgi:hypothetical protein
VELLILIYYVGFALNLVVSTEFGRASMRFDRSAMHYQHQYLRMMSHSGRRAAKEEAFNETHAAVA